MKKQEGMCMCARPLGRLTLAVNRPARDSTVERRGLASRLLQHLRLQREPEKTLVLRAA